MLAGGRSSRMGAPKASLEWHGSTLLCRVAGILARTLDGPVVVARAPGQPLPHLPSACEVVEDRRGGRGPLEAIAAGLAAIAGRAEVAFVAATDAPFLHPALLAVMLDRLDEADDVCVPVLGGVAQPLAAAYRSRVAPAVERLLDGDRLRLGLLLDCCRVRRLSPAQLLGDDRLARADPHLESLVNLNGPDDYAAARARPAPQISVQRLGEEAGPARAATLGQAARAAGVDLAAAVVALVNGRPAALDPELPLVAGDAVAFAAAQE